MRPVLACLAIFAAGAWAQEISGMAVGILDQAAAAQQAVAQHDQAAALDHIRMAKALSAEIIQSAGSPSSQLLVEVRRDTETTTTYADVKHHKGEMSADRLKKNTNVAEVDQQVTASMLDVTGASQHLDAAQDAIQRGEWGRADAALGAIPNSVTQSKVTGDMPLLRAKSNLELARTRALNGKYKDARAPLRAAAQALADFDRRFPGPHAEDADRMRRQMLEYADRIDDHRGDILDHINVMWLDPIAKWQQEGGTRQAGK